MSLLMKVCQGGGPTGFAFGLVGDGDFDNGELFELLAKDFPREIDALEADLVMKNEPAAQFRQLQRDLGRLGWFKGVAQYALRPQALILESDRDPLDVVLRRSTALLDKLKQTSAAGKLGPLESALRRLGEQAAGIDVRRRGGPLQALPGSLPGRRQIAFTNPLLDFDKLLFVKRHFLPPSEGLGNHMCDQFFGFHAIAGGGLYVLDDILSGRPKCRDVLAHAVCGNGRFEGKRLEPGAFLSPALSYDGKTIIFAYTEGKPTRYRWSEESTWHLFKVQVDGSHLVQLTDGPTNDFHPCYLPNGRIAFISERRGGFGRCHGRPVPTYTLHTMNADGSDITCISFHETNEWYPSVNHDGMIVYTRWDYVDRGHSQAHHPWITTPDGRDARVIQGNYGRSGNARPNMEMQVRAIPGSRDYVATATAHHGQAYGSLVVIDPSIPDDDAMAPLKMLTPEIGFPESTAGNDLLYYSTDWPLSEDFHLCAYDGDGATRRGPANRYGIYLIDSFGNKELIYRDAAISCQHPMPLRPEKVPPLLPQVTLVGLPPAAATPRHAEELPQTANVGVMNVYDSLKPWPEGTRITALRIVQVLPKTTPSADGPKIGYGDQKNARQVLGTVPVEADGSAYFKLPVGKPVYFQALDGKGLAVQSMRSDAYVHPGETLMCQGCHEPQRRAVHALDKQQRMALLRKPSEIAADVEGSRPLSFARLVQPVLDRKCVDCHARPERKAPSLAKGNWEKNNHLWYTSVRQFGTLRLVRWAFRLDGAAEYAWAVRGPGREALQAVGRRSLRREASADDMHRITLWLDCNSDFFGQYEHTQEQSQGQAIMPSLE